VLKKECRFDQKVLTISTLLERDHDNLKTKSKKEAAHMQPLLRPIS